MPVTLTAEGVIVEGECPTWTITKDNVGFGDAAVAFTLTHGEETSTGSLKVN